MAQPAAWQIWLAAVITLGVYSYLINDNKFYRMLLNVMIGLGVGYNLIVIWKNTLGPLWWEPMISGFAALFHGFKPGSAGALWIFVGFLGLLWYFQFSRKYFWLSRIVIGMTLGAGAGMVFKQQLLLNVPQITDSIRPLLARTDGTPLYHGTPGMQFSPWMSINNIIFVVTIICVMTYFLFSFEHKSPVIKGSATAGRWLLMISFGAFFGNTVMTRMAVLLERVQFLMTDWRPIVPGWFWVIAAFTAALLAAYYRITYRKRRKPAIEE